MSETKKTLLIQEMLNGERQNKQCQILLKISPRPSLNKEGNPSFFKGGFREDFIYHH